MVSISELQLHKDSLSSEFDLCGGESIHEAYRKVLTRS